jgi:hydrogenase nickel incorporation protein HypA/HybF
MHELSVSENILDISLRYARENNAKKINDIYLVIGDYQRLSMTRFNFTGILFQIIR